MESGEDTDGATTPHERIARTMKFRPDDPPEVREALVQERVKVESTFFRESLEPSPETDE